MASSLGVLGLDFNRPYGNMGTIPEIFFERRLVFLRFADRFYRQLRYGCKNPACSTPTCLSCRKRSFRGPFRRFTMLSARSLANFLASEDRPWRRLCPHESNDGLQPLDHYIPFARPSLSPIFAEIWLQGLDVSYEKDKRDLMERLAFRHGPENGMSAAEECVDQSKLGRSTDVRPPQTQTRRELSKEAVSLKDDKSLSQSLLDTEAFLDPLGAGGSRLSRSRKKQLIISEYLLPVMRDGNHGDGMVEGVRRVDNQYLPVHALSHLSPAIIRGMVGARPKLRKTVKVEEQLLLKLGRTKPFSPLEDHITVAAHNTDAIYDETLKSMLCVLSTPACLLNSFVEERTQTRDLSQLSKSFPGGIQSTSEYSLTTAYRARTISPLKMIWCFHEMYFPDSKVLNLILGCLRDIITRTSNFPRNESANEESMLSLASDPQSSSNTEYYQVILDRPNDLDGYLPLDPSKEAHIHCIILGALASLLPIAHVDFVIPAWKTFVTHRKAGRSIPHWAPRSQGVASAVLLLVDTYSNPTASDVVKGLTRAFGFRLRQHHKKDFTKYTEQITAWIQRQSDMPTDEIYTVNVRRGKEVHYYDGQLGTAGEGGPSFARIVLEWIRTVVLSDWDYQPLVPRWGPVGGALRFMACLYEKRHQLNLDSDDFVTPYIAEMLDTNRACATRVQADVPKDQAHLFDFPFLFKPSDHIEYFRTINYTRMNAAADAALARANLFLRVSSIDVPRQMDTMNRTQHEMTRVFVMNIGRESLLEDAIDNIWRSKEEELKRPLKVRLGTEQGEEGDDLGGVQQEFFALIFSEALNPDYGLFTIEDETQTSWFRPLSYEPIYKLELLGTLAGLAVYNGVTLPVNFPMFFYMKLLDLPTNKLEDISDIWPQLGRSLQLILDYEGSDLEDVFTIPYSFSIQSLGTVFEFLPEHISGLSLQSKRNNLRSFSSFKSSVHDNARDDEIWRQEAKIALQNDPLSRAVSYLVPGADLSTFTPIDEFQGEAAKDQAHVQVLNISNRKQYVQDRLKFETTFKIRPQYEAFAAGFFKCVDKEAIRMFRPEGLKRLVEGYRTIDVKELKQITEYEGYTAESPVIQNFWQVVEDFSQEQLRHLLRFVTACERIPVLGIKYMKFVIQKNGVGDNATSSQYFPSSSTCFSRLLLPEYADIDTLRSKLTVAIQNDTYFFMR